MFPPEVTFDANSALPHKLSFHRCNNIRNSLGEVIKYMQGIVQKKGEYGLPAEAANMFASQPTWPAFSHSILQAYSKASGDDPYAY